MLVSDFLKLFQNAPKWARVDVDYVAPYGLNYEIGVPYSQEALNEISSLKDHINDNEKIIDNLAKETQDLENDLSETKESLEKARETLDSYQISPTETLQELIDRCEAQEEQINNYRQNLQNFHKNQLDLTREIKELRARKNKVAVKRDLYTGKLYVEYDGIKYNLEKHDNQQ
jgi:chromosome segregation ATPase